MVGAVLAAGAEEREVFGAEVRAPNRSLQLTPVVCSWRAHVLRRVRQEQAEGCKVSESSIWLSETASFLILLSLLPPLKAKLMPGMTAPLATLSHISINICSPGLCIGAAVNQPSQ